MDTPRSSELFDNATSAIFNIKEQMYDKLWRLKPHRIHCRFCGKVLDSRESDYSPEASGWEYAKYSHSWMCPSCFNNFKEQYVNKQNIRKIVFMDGRIWENT